MTPEDRIADALLAADDDDTRTAWLVSDHAALARAILAADPTIAADLALAAAVRGLMSQDWADIKWTRVCGGLWSEVPNWYVTVSDGGGAGGDFLPAAIEEALR